MEGLRTGGEGGWAGGEGGGLRLRMLLGQGMWLGPGAGLGLGQGLHLGLWSPKQRAG